MAHVFTAKAIIRTELFRTQMSFAFASAADRETFMLKVNETDGQVAWSDSVIEVSSVEEALANIEREKEVQAKIAAGEA